ncbi:MAG: methyl-accepting chemotaxis protein [Polyangiaceae bacterium]
MSVKAQLGLGFGVVVGVFVFTFAGAWNSLAKVTSDVRIINDESLKYLIVADSMDLSRSEVQQFLTDVAATHDRAALAEAAASAKRFSDGAARFKELYAERNDAGHLREMNDLESEFEAFDKLGRKMAEVYITEGTEAGNRLMKGTASEPGFDAASERIAKHLGEFRERQVVLADESTRAALAAASSTLRGLIWGGVIAVIAAVLVATLIVRRILRQLGGEPSYVAEVVSRVADGDLSVRVETRAGDETSMLFAVKTMASRLAHIVDGVREGAGLIMNSTREVAVGNDDLSRRTESQAASLEETAASLEQLSATVKQNANSAGEANELSQHASEVAAKGGQAVRDVAQTMAHVRNRSQEIVNIVDVIEGIAFQTNILALNASVEAARAGDQGRGFAVVATEVRQLAQRAAGAAKEIKVLIGSSVESIKTASSQADSAGETMGNIVRAVGRVTEIMAAVAAASSQQSVGIEQINQAVSQLDGVTQQNSALGEEAAAAAQSMREQAERLWTAVDVFRIDDSAPIREAKQEALESLAPDSEWGSSHAWETPPLAADMKGSSRLQHSVDEPQPYL